MHVIRDSNRIDVSHIGGDCLIFEEVLDPWCLILDCDERNRHVDLIEGVACLHGALNRRVNIGMARDEDRIRLANKRSSNGIDSQGESINIEEYEVWFGVISLIFWCERRLFKGLEALLDHCGSIVHGELAIGSLNVVLKVEYCDLSDLEDLAFEKLACFKGY